MVFPNAQFKAHSCNTIIQGKQQKQPQSQFKRSKEQRTTTFRISTFHNSKNQILKAEKLKKILKRKQAWDGDG